MSIFDFLKPININQELKAFEAIPGAILLDVRTKEEYAEGHIPKSINIPVDDILEVEKVITDREAPVYVYCLRGTRSRRAVSKMKMLGYKNAKSIGGIASYKGMVVM